MGLPPKIITKQNRIKNDRNNPEKQRPKFSYFDKQENSYGSTWLNQKNPSMFRNDAKAILRDLIRQNIDLEKDAHYFNELIIINTLMNISFENIKKYSIIVSSIEYHMYNMKLYNYIVPDDESATYMEYKTLLTMYQKLYETFNKIFISKEAKMELEVLYQFLNRYNGKFYLEDDTITEIYQYEIGERWRNINDTQRN